MPSLCVLQHSLGYSLQHVQAQRVLEYGLSRHGSFVAEPEYVLAYVDVLLYMRDEANLRVLLERVLSPNALPPERAPLVWDRFVELELWRTAVRRHFKTNTVLISLQVLIFKCYFYYLEGFIPNILICDRQTTIADRLVQCKYHRHYLLALKV